jgi:uncharacterized protein YukE
MAEVGIYEVAAAVITFLIGLGGAAKYYSKFKRMLKEVTEAASAVVDLLETLHQAFEDNKLTPEEIEKIVQEYKKVRKEVNDVIKEAKLLL